MATVTPRPEFADDSSPAKEIELHDGQIRALDSPARFVAICSGTGGGKTYTGPIWLYQEILKHPRDKYLITAPTYKILNNATMPTLIAHFAGTQLEGRWLEQKGQYRLPTGGVIYTGTGENPYAIEGVHCRAAWMDEAGQYSRQVWIVVQARVGRVAGRVLATTTPYMLNWLYTEWYKRWKDGDKNYDIITFSSIANPTYNLDEYTRAKATLDPSVFAMRYEGRFVRMEGLVYSEFMDWTIDEADLPIRIRGERYGGIDFGFHHPFAAYKATLDRDDILWVLDERHKSGTVTDDHHEWMDLKDRDREWFADPSNAERIESLERAGFRLQKAENAVEFGIEAVIERGRSGRLKIVRQKCPNLITESETYCRDDKGKPIKIDDDGMDALRYIVASIKASRVSRPEIAFV